MTVNSIDTTLRGLIFRLASVIGIIVFCFFTIKISTVTLFQSWFPETLSPALSSMFEFHFWQFTISFFAIILLSRGHLWSYGISSERLKLSLKYLLWTYGFSISLFVILKFASIEFTAYRFSRGSNNVDTIFLFMINWMSSPVADQILFFGFAQTLFLKNLDLKLRVGNIIIPSALFISTALFVIFRFTFHTAIPYTTNIELNLVIDSIFGFFLGYVYYSTHSLLMPMLGQAFFYGLPYFSSFISK